MRNTMVSPSFIDGSFLITDHASRVMLTLSEKLRIAALLDGANVLEVELGSISSVKTDMDDLVDCVRIEYQC